MADDEIQRLRRAAERCGPAPLLLQLCHPDHGDLLRRAGPEAQATLRAMLEYVGGLERWTITQVVENVRQRKLTVEALDEATGERRSHDFKRWVRANDYQRRRDNEFYGRFLAVLVRLGADPVLHETWVGKVVHVRAGYFGGIMEFPAPTFAEHLATIGAAPPVGWRPAPGPAAAARLVADPAVPPGDAEEFDARPA